MLTLNSLSLALLGTGKLGNNFVLHALLRVIKLVVAVRNYSGLYSGDLKFFVDGRYRCF